MSFAKYVENLNKKNENLGKGRYQAEVIIGVAAHPESEARRRLTEELQDLVSRGNYVSGFKINSITER
jgi:hypothetical protein